jgi:hypothetical protein
LIKEKGISCSADYTKPYVLFPILLQQLTTRSYIAQVSHNQTLTGTSSSYASAFDNQTATALELEIKPPEHATSPGTAHLFGPCPLHSYHPHQSTTSYDKMEAFMNQPRFATRFGDFQANNPTARETVDFLTREEDEMDAQIAITDELIRYLERTPRQQGWIVQAYSYEYLLARDADPNDAEPKLNFCQKVAIKIKLVKYSALRWWINEKGRRTIPWNFIKRRLWWSLLFFRFGSGGSFGAEAIDDFPGPDVGDVFDGAGAINTLDV